MVLDSNLMAQELVALNKAQILGSDPRGYTAPELIEGSDPRAYSRERISLSLAGQPQRFEWNLRRADGQVIETEVNLSSFEVGGQTLLQAVIRDISSRKRAEAELRASEQTLRTIFDSAYDAFFIHDLEGRVLDVNRRTLELYGISRTEALSYTIFNEFSARNNDMEALAENWSRVLAGETLNFEWISRKPHSEELFAVEVALNRIEYHGQPAILATVHDISGRKQAEAELRASEESLRTIFDSSYDAFFIHDKQGRLLDVNRRMLEIYGLTRSEALRFEIIRDYSAPGNDLEALARHWSKVCRGEPVNFEWKARTPLSGELFDV
jgi:PAS domain S-box-containing protein